MDRRTVPVGTLSMTGLVGTDGILNLIHEINRCTALVCTLQERNNAPRIPVSGKLLSVTVLLSLFKTAITSSDRRHFRPIVSEDSMHHVKLFLLIVFALCASQPTLAEGTGLPMPKEIKRAYERGTRSMDGRPGPRYWQNSADYDISVNVNPAKRFLEGSERISYRNNSLDTLKTLVFRLYQNMNQPTAPRGTSIGVNAVTDGMRLQELSIDGVERTLFPTSEEVRIDHTVMRVTPPVPLPPGSITSISVKWSFTIPVTTGEGGGNPRMGAYENGSLFLAYWFPRLAVYDDIRGWDLLPYDGENEFYHDYGNMRVAITVPDSCGVWATGMLNNPEQVLREPFLARYRQALTSDSVVRIIDASDLQGKPPYTASAKGNTWIFEASDVPDVAFGVGARYRWDAVAAKVGERRVLVDAAYDAQSTSFQTAADEGRITVEMMSAARPGVPFPYPAMTVFNGYYGMEFPMIVNDGTFGNRITDVYVHSHEIAHTYFPFMVGINETRYAWMDEGMAYFLPVDVQKSLSKYDHMNRAARGYERFSGSEMDYPMIMPSVASSGDNLQVIGYLKPAMAFAVLRDMLGEERFDTALREFIASWTSKHPLPWDFFHTFDRVTGEKLEWFWRSWFFDFGMPDLAIAGVRTTERNTRITVTRNGSIPVPILVTVNFGGGEKRTIHRPASVWADGATEAIIDIETNTAIESVQLGGGWIPDGKPSDNTWKPS